MTSLRSFLVLLVASFALFACATTGSSSSSEPERGVSTNKIVVDKLDISTGDLTAFEIVRRYKSHWLQKRGRMSINNPVPVKVYLDGTGSALGGVRSLRQIQASSIAYIQHFSGMKAQAKFGPGNNAGAIYVKTKTGG